ncbi:MAG: ATPase domain-containing protein, partial [Thermoplasmata archaeon]
MTEAGISKPKDASGQLPSASKEKSQNTYRLAGWSSGIVFFLSLSYILAASILLFSGNKSFTGEIQQKWTVISVILLMPVSSFLLALFIIGFKRMTEKGYMARTLVWLSIAGLVLTVIAGGAVVKLFTDEKKAWLSILSIGISNGVLLLSIYLTLRKIPVLSLLLSFVHLALPALFLLFPKEILFSTTDYKISNILIVVLLLMGFTSLLSLVPFLSAIEKESRKKSKVQPKQDSSKLHEELSRRADIIYDIYQLLTLANSPEDMEKKMALSLRAADSLELRQIKLHITQFLESKKSLHLRMRELQAKEQTLLNLEQQVREREASLEARELQVRNYLSQLNEKYDEVDVLEADLIKQRTELQEREHQLSDREAELKELEVKLEWKEKDIETEYVSIEKLRTELLSREQALKEKEILLQQKEKDSKAMSSEIAALLEDLRYRENLVQSQEARLKEREESVERKMKELIMQEKRLSQMETMKMPSGPGLTSAQTPLSSLQQRQVGSSMTYFSLPESADRIKELEEELHRTKKLLAERNAAGSGNSAVGKVTGGAAGFNSELEKTLLEKEKKAVEDMKRHAEMRLEEIRKRREELDRKEKEMLLNDAKIEAKAKELAAKEKQIEERKAELASRSKALWQDQLRLTKLTALLSSRDKEIKKLKETIDSDKKKIEAREAAIKEELEKLWKEKEEVLKKQREAEVLEQRLKLMEMEMKRKEQEYNERMERLKQQEAELPNIALAMQRMVQDDSSRRIMELQKKEEELRKREKDLVGKLVSLEEAKAALEQEYKKREEALMAYLKKDLEKMNELVKKEYESKKIKTGHARIDDLMLGGIPTGTNVLISGPPFIGKEVFLMKFVAEGLSKGVHAVICLNNMGPADFRRYMGPIMPAFAEYERLGLVHFLDMYTIPNEEQPDDEKVVYIDKPDPNTVYKAISSIIDSIPTSEACFRMVFISLSTMMTQTDARSVYS